MSQHQTFNQFTIIQQSDQQIQIIAPNLFNDSERINILQTVLLMREAITDIQIEPKTNQVTIKYDSNVLPKENLLTLLSAVLKNFDQKPHKSKEPTPIQQDNVEQDFTFKIKGMSCGSCALFLEMSLTRKTEVIQASINFESKSGSVKGYLKQEDIIELIEKNGYQPHSFNKVS